MNKQSVGYLLAALCLCVFTGCSEMKASMAGYHRNGRLLSLPLYGVGRLREELDAMGS